MCTDIGSNCRPREGIGIVWSQSEALSEETDSNLALSASEVTEWIKRSNLALYRGLSHSD